MNARPDRPALRRFLRGLVFTCLGLLLPCQLFLLWLAKTDSPVRLPDKALAAATEALAARGIRFSARSLAINPDQTLRAEDVTLGFEDVGDDVLAAERVDLRVGLSALARGRIEPTGVVMTGGRLSLPARLSGDGRPRTIIEKAALDVAFEGRWAVLRVLRLQTREITAFASGEAPVAAFALALPNEEGLRPAEALRQADAWIRRLEDGGVRSIEVRLRSDGPEAAIASLSGLAPRAVTPAPVADVRATELRVDVTAALRPGRVTWTAEASARSVTWGAGDEAMTLSEVTAAAAPKGTPGQIGIVAKAERIEKSGWPSIRCRLETTTDGDFRRATTRFRTSTEGSAAEGEILTEGRTWRSAKISHAALCMEEAMRLSPVADALRQARASVGGSVILRAVSIESNSDGGIARARGHADLSGLNIIGLSSESIAPGRSLPVSTGFDYDYARGEKPLRLPDLRLASVTGEAEVSLRAGGPFSLHLRGDLAPGSLDQVLGRWWVDLWTLFKVRRDPYAYIDVDGEWTKPGARTTGRVKLEDFDFMGAPFRGVEVKVDADMRRTFIGLEDLAGGSLPAHGSVDGKVTWDWSLPSDQAGPHLDVSGDMEPWIAARCAGEGFGGALKELRLPATRRLRVTSRPEGGRLAISAEIEAPGVSQAWGLPLLNLKARTEGAGENMRIRSSFGLAKGEAQLDVSGDVLHKPAVGFSIRGASPELLIGTLNGIKPDPAQTGKSLLDLDFRGEIDLKNPRKLKGTGAYHLSDPELKKVRLLGGLSGLLEELGVEATSYELQEAKGTYGCLDGKAYLPDLTVTGPQSMLTLSGVSDLEGGQLDFIGDFSLLNKGGVPLIGFFNPNRALVALTKIRVKGTFSNPSTSAIPRLSDLIKYNDYNNLGKIPPALRQ